MGKVGGKEGNVVTKSNLNSVHRGWRIVAIAGQRVSPKDVSSALASAQQRPRFSVTFRIGDKQADEDADADEHAALVEQARRDAEERERASKAAEEERLRLEAEEAACKRKENEEAERKRREAEEALRKQREANEEA